MCFQWWRPTWNIFKMVHCISCLSDLTRLPQVTTRPNHQDAAVKNKSFLVAQRVQVGGSIRDSTTGLSQKCHPGPQVKMNAMGSLSTGGHTKTPPCTLELNIGSQPGPKAPETHRSPGSNPTKTDPLNHWFSFKPEAWLPSWTHLRCLYQLHCLFLLVLIFNFLIFNMIPPF